MYHYVYNTIFVESQSLFTSNQELCWKKMSSCGNIFYCFPKVWWRRY